MNMLIEFNLTIKLFFSSQLGFQLIKLLLQAFKLLSSLQFKFNGNKLIIVS